tara:strand:+ start:1653 stop:2147 length:495 start_codon:yes stop_codon:yes gene_type:complete
MTTSGERNNGWAGVAVDWMIKALAAEQESTVSVHVLHDVACNIFVDVRNKDDTEAISTTPKELKACDCDPEFVGVFEKKHDEESTFLLSAKLSYLKRVCPWLCDEHLVRKILQFDEEVGEEFTLSAGLHFTDFDGAMGQIFIQKSLLGSMCDTRHHIAQVEILH